VLIGDSLMFQRGEPTPSDSHLSHIYGMALPLLKRGMPIAPVQLENLTVSNYPAGFRVLLLTYHGMKPISPEVHAPLADWVKRGGALVVCDDDSDPYNAVRDWWNSDGRRHATPREHLFAQLGVTVPSTDASATNRWAIGNGSVTWLRENPARLASDKDGDARWTALLKQTLGSAGINWRETSHLLLRRGPYVIGAGLDESIEGERKTLRGRFVNLFDPALAVRESVTLEPRSRVFLLDLEAAKAPEPRVLASACKALPIQRDPQSLILAVEGVARTPAVVLLSAQKAPASITLAGEPIKSFNHSAEHGLLWIRFTNESRPRELVLRF
jgi:hypothetical protein